MNVSRATFKNSNVSQNNVKDSSQVSSVSRAKDLNTMSHATLSNNSIPAADQTETPDHYRLNSLSLIEPHPLPDMDVDTEIEEEILPPPKKKARARYIFQRCLIPSQHLIAPLTSEVFAPPSDSEED